MVDFALIFFLAILLSLLGFLIWIVIDHERQCARDVELGEMRLRAEGYREEDET